MRFLLRPGWLAFIALVVGFAVACYTLLAPWQFGREEQREAQEQAIATADATPPVPLAELVPPGSAVTPELEWRQVTVTGTYLAEAEAVVRLRTLDGKPAVEVLTPMRLDDGRVVAVDRGLAPVTDAGRGAGVPGAARRHGHGDGAAARRTSPTRRTGRSCAVRGPPQLYAADSRRARRDGGLDLVCRDPPAAGGPARGARSGAGRADGGGRRALHELLLRPAVVDVRADRARGAGLLHPPGDAAAPRAAAAGPAGRSVRRALAGDDIGRPERP